MWWLTDLARYRLGRGFCDLTINRFVNNLMKNVPDYLRILAVRLNQALWSWLRFSRNSRETLPAFRCIFDWGEFLDTSTPFVVNCDYWSGLQRLPIL